MRLTLTCTTLLFISGGLLMGINTTVAGADADVSLNRQWALQMFSSKPSDTKPGNRLIVVHEDGAGDTKMGRSAAGGPILLGDKKYAHGIGVNSHSVIRVKLTQPAAKFLATIGIDRNADKSPASVRFHVAVDGKDKFVTDVMKARATPKAIDVQLGGAKEFVLTVDNGGDSRDWDQADWADAKVVLQDGSEVWLDELTDRAPVKAHLPFSFIYGGKHSSEFINSWKRRVADEKLDKTAIRRTITLTDPATHLEVRAVCTIYLDTPGVDWTVYFTNKGTKDTPILEQVRALDATVAVAPAGGVTLRRISGSTCSPADWMPFDRALPEGRSNFATSDGRSSNVSPWFTLQWQGGGVITAIGWSGQWTASVELARGTLRTQAGMQNLHTVLRAGETIRTPRIMQIYWRGSDQWRAYNLFRRTMMAHIMPRIDGKLVHPPIVHLSTSFYELNASNEKNVLSHLDSIKGLGFEMFWLDAYWTGPSGFPTSMGNYGFPIERVEPKDRFPNGMKAISDAVEKAGLGYLMWFEPERVAPNTLLAKEHPEWVLSPSKNGSGLFNLGIPEARKFMTKYLNAVIKAYNLSCIRFDYNIGPLAYWQFADSKDPNRVGIAEIRYVEGLYQMWDDILAANPKLFIDDCAGGGRRIDLETMSRAIPLWRSDNTCDMLSPIQPIIRSAAIKNQIMSAGLNRYVPFSTTGQMGATPYLFRSGFNGGIAFCEDVRSKNYPRELLKQGIAEGKRIRKYYSGNFYVLSKITLRPDDWCIMQYHRPDKQDGMVVAFRRHQSPYVGYGAELHEIDASADYQVTMSHSYKPDKPVIMKGAALQKLKVEIYEQPGSVIIEYKKITR